MNTDLVLWFIALIVPIVVSYLIFRYEQSKTKIFYFSKQFVQLYNDLTKNILELSITYKGREIQKKMFVSKGVFICSGKTDILNSDVQKGIILSLAGNDAKWHDYKITKKSADLDINIVATDSTKLQIDFPLFKNQDYFVFEALGESDEATFYFNHRINNVQKIIINPLGVEKTAGAYALASLFFTMLLLWVFSSALSNATSLSSTRTTFYNNNMNEIDRYVAVDTLPHKPYVTPEWVADVLSDTHKIELAEWIPQEKRKAITETLANIRRDHYLSTYNFQKSSRKSDSEFYSKYPEVKRYYDVKLDSVFKIADSEYSKFKLGLLLNGKTKLYRLGPRYYVKFRAYNTSFDLIFLLVFLILILVGIVFITKFGTRYFRYNGIASRATKILK